jgi:hypothetical protein
MPINECRVYLIFQEVYTLILKIIIYMVTFPHYDLFWGMSDTTFLWFEQVTLA